MNATHTILRKQLTAENIIDAQREFIETIQPLLKIKQCLIESSGRKIHIVHDAIPRIIYDYGPGVAERLLQIDETINEVARMINRRFNL